MEAVRDAVLPQPVHLSLADDLIAVLTEQYKNVVTSFAIERTNY